MSGEHRPITKRLLCLMLPVLLMMCSGCSAEKELPKVSEIGFYLDTVITLTAYTKEEKVLKEANRVLKLETREREEKKGDSQ